MSSRMLLSRLAVSISRVSTFNALQRKLPLFVLQQQSSSSPLPSLMIRQQPLMLTSVRCIEMYPLDPKEPVNREEIQLRVFKAFSKHDKVDQSQLKLEAHIFNDLGLDSLDHVELIMAVEDEFNIDIDDVQVEKLFTIQNVVDFVCETLDSQEPPHQNPGPKYDPHMSFGKLDTAYV